MIIRTPAEIGALIRDRRRELGLEQRALAEKVGVSRQWLIDVEKGKPRAEIGLILRTLKALGLTLQVGGEPPRASRKRSADVDIDAIITAARKRNR